MMPPVFQDPRADEWEQRQLDKIKQRYEKQEEIVATWENEHKRKAELKYEKIEAELKEKMARALRRYEEEIEGIEGISREARAQLESEKKREEHKVKEEANQIRFTGTFPEQSCSLM
ncbi:unnamed protein product [Cuscuta campestris]|uniref:Remorin C-terminal domain-containing protein n=1 Tax=Cuscuta campestris TaxID=132261 RepID=A0A484KRS2_9ASTE|nr:unnamed protein product [Cuscuta campestris]